MRDFHAERVKRRKRSDDPPQPPAESREGKRPPSAAAPPAEGPRYPHTVRLSLNADLYAALQELLESAHAAGDYRYTSLPDLIRAAFRAYRDGAPLTAAAAPGPKKHSTLQLDGLLYEAYRKLPERKRWEILERAIRSFLKTL